MEDNISTYEINIRFGSTVSEDEANGWLADILSVLPEGAEGKLTRPPLVLGVEELGPEHRGYTLDWDKVHGKIDAIFPLAGTDYGRMVLLDGRAITLPPYAVVSLVN